MRQALELRPVRSLIETALRQVGERTSIPFAVRFAEGGEQRTSGQPPAFTLVFRDARAYWRIAALDRKSTRLNSSHTVISYAVFCLKKKNKNQSYQHNNMPS